MRVLVVMWGLVVLSGCTALGSQTAGIDLSGTAGSLESPAVQVDSPAPAPAVEPPVRPDVFPVLRAADVNDAVSETVGQYVTSTDEATRSGGQEGSAIEQVVTAEWLPIEQRGFREYQQRQIRTIGSTRVDHLTVQSARRTAQGTVEVAVFACIDARSVWVIDAEATEPPVDLVDWLERGSPPDEPSDEQVAAWEEYAADVQPQLGVSEPVLFWLVGTDPNRLRIDATETWRGYHPCNGHDTLE